MYTIENNTPTIYLYGYIGAFEDIQAAEFVREMTELASAYDSITLRVNSGGGDVFDGLAIINACRPFRDKITVIVDGVAASMAAMIVLSFPKSQRKISSSAVIMLHQVTTGAFGSAGDLRSAAQMAESLNSILSTILVDSTGKDEKYVKENYMMVTDRWFTAIEAVTEGLFENENVIDSNEKPVNATSDLKDVYKYYASYFNPKNNMKKVALFIAAFAASGIVLPENADEDQVLEKLKGILANNNTLKTEVQGLKQKITDAENAEKSKKAAGVKALLDKAILDKKIKEADRQSWQSLFDANYDSAEMALQNLPSATLIDRRETDDKRKEWTWDDWSKKDPSGLERERTAKSTLYIDLYKQKFNVEPKL